MSDFQFKCSTCNEIHSGMPVFGADYPMTVLQVPEEERESRVELGLDDCVIDEKDFYVRGCIEIPVEGFEDAFSWGTWVSLSEESYRTYVQYFYEAKRSDVEPFFGWHCCDFIAYDETCLNLKTRVHMRDNGIRPFIELEPTEHPLAIEQREGITQERLKEIYELVMHGK